MNFLSQMKAQRDVTEYEMGKHSQEQNSIWEKNYTLRKALEQAEYGWRQSIACAQVLQESLAQKNDELSEAYRNIASLHEDLNQQQRQQQRGTSTALITAKVDASERELASNSEAAINASLHASENALLQSEVALYKGEIKKSKQTEEKNIHELTKIGNDLCLLFSRVSLSVHRLFKNTSVRSDSKLLSTFDNKWVMNRYSHVEAKSTQDELYFYSQNALPVPIGLIRGSMSELCRFAGWVEDAAFCLESVVQNPREADDVPTSALSYDLPASSREPLGPSSRAEERRKVKDLNQECPSVSNKGGLRSDINKGGSVLHQEDRSDSWCARNFEPSSYHELSTTHEHISDSEQREHHQSEWAEEDSKVLFTRRQSDSHHTGDEGSPLEVNTPMHHLTPPVPETHNQTGYVHGQLNPSSREERGGNSSTRADSIEHSGDECLSGSMNRPASAHPLHHQTSYSPRSQPSAEKHHPLSLQKQPHQQQDESSSEYHISEWATTTTQSLPNEHHNTDSQSPVFQSSPKKDRKEVHSQVGSVSVSTSPRGKGRDDIEKNEDISSPRTDSVVRGTTGGGSSGGSGTTNRRDSSIQQRSIKRSDKRGRGNRKQKEYNSSGHLISTSSKEGDNGPPIKEENISLFNRSTQSSRSRPSVSSTFASRSRQASSTQRNTKLVSSSKIGSSSHRNSSSALRKTSSAPGIYLSIPKTSSNTKGSSTNKAISMPRRTYVIGSRMNTGKLGGRHLQLHVFPSD